MQQDQTISSVRLVTRNVQSQQKLESYAFVIPFKPLAFNTTYHAKVIGVLDGVNFSK